MKKFTKVLSIILSAVMISSSMPFTALAEEPEAVSEAEAVIEENIEEETPLEFNRRHRREKSI
ncbi:MAG: hypothetical protein Q4C42_08350, partial [Clostridia bacterium]|nr:hypothetical protein [Clostridia bacterium]